MFLKIIRNFDNHYIKFPQILLEFCLIFIHDLPKIFLRILKLSTSLPWSFFTISTNYLNSFLNGTARIFFKIFSKFYVRMLINYTQNAAEIFQTIS